jgi:DNA-binding transcriptional ArsR family regulator
MAAPHREGRLDAVPVLPGDVPVVMPDLPTRMLLTTMEQFKAFSDPTRERILGIIQTEPATAKQIASRLGMAPGTIGHHLQVLESAGLAQVVARRLVRGIVAKYYTRTARIFSFDMAHEITGQSHVLTFLDIARDELASALRTGDDSVCLVSGFPHARLGPERAREFAERLRALVEEFIQAPPDPSGQVYGLCHLMFVGPAYLQSTDTPARPVSVSEE